MNYKMVDFSTWPRGDLFQFYMDHMRVVMRRRWSGSSSSAV